ncbi:MAG TPA: bifunctional DNA-formamidopyrimidine glycosylase/DNA-(apurinic or apyrimidinic site) lyase [Syntrophales bacterium]|nr:bifunctional DNA-formamidopyrimidine glycosylase/DNA-(apurinic or apyrimidinic site) lyase [Syntrophales bacterium]
MPELPEIETLCRQLRSVIVGRPILSSRVIDPKLQHLPPLAGKAVRSISRHGKKMVWTLSDGMCLIFQMRMTGRLFWLEGGEIPPHARLVFSFEGGGLVLSDPRRFATVHLCSPPAASTVPDGLEKLDPKRLAEAACRRRLPVKSFLLDQKAVAGIGNIYASEILHKAGINPLRPACGLEPAEWKKVAAVAARVLKTAVDSRGTSISDWQDLFAHHGEYQRRLRVYGQKGEPCATCRSEILRIVIAGRSTFYCPKCQK